MWRVRQRRIALVSFRRQACPEHSRRDAVGTQGRDGLATNGNRDEAATHLSLNSMGGGLKRSLGMVAHEVKHVHDLN